MSIIIIKKCLKTTKIGHTSTCSKMYTKEQDERQVQPMGNELVNAPNIDVAQRGEVSE
jgi:hypothetical protein